MRLMILATAAALAAATVPAAAQYGGGYGGFGGRPDYGGPPPGYGYGGPPPYDPYRRPPPPGYGPRYRGVCVTSRGSCGAGPRPLGAGCRCDIPGFGLKRGIVQ